MDSIALIFENVLKQSKDITELISEYSISSQGDKSLKKIPKNLWIFITFDFFPKIY